MMTIRLLDKIPLSAQVRVVYHDRLPGRGLRCGLVFQDLSEQDRQTLLLNLYADPATWKDAHANRLRSSFLMACHLLYGLIRHVTPHRTSRRQIPRQQRFQIIRIQAGDRQYRAILRDQSAEGLGIIIFTFSPSISSTWLMLDHFGQMAAYRPLYGVRRWGVAQRLGLRAIPQPPQPEPHR
jgi:hypothetical protein